MENSWKSLLFSYTLDASIKSEVFLPPQHDEITTLLFYSWSNVLTLFIEDKRATAALEAFTTVAYKDQSLVPSHLA